MFLVLPQVGNGNRCDSGFLYRERAYTLRQTEDAKGEPVVYIHTIRGRSDVAVTNMGVPEPGHIRRFMVKFVLEIKTPKDLVKQAKGCVREAVMQLIGLNLANHRSSPAVILTNLVQNHRVYWLDRVSQTPLLFQICYLSFASLGDAVDEAIRRSWPLTTTSRRFGSAPTPTPSPVDSPPQLRAVAEAGETDEEDHEVVLFDIEDE